MKKHKNKKSSKKTISMDIETLSQNGQPQLMILTEDEKCFWQEIRKSSSDLESIFQRSLKFSSLANKQKTKIKTNVSDYLFGLKKADWFKDCIENGGKTLPLDFAIENNIPIDFGDILYYNE